MAKTPKGWKKVAQGKKGGLYFYVNYFNLNSNKAIRVEQAYIRKYYQVVFGEKYSNTSITGIRYWKQELSKKDAIKIAFNYMKKHPRG